jgi:hypothetical protein
MKKPMKWIEKMREAREARAYTQSGLLRRAEENAAPGGVTPEGFLGRDARRLGHIIRADEMEFQNLGLDWEKTADILDDLLLRGSAGLGDAVTLGGFLVRVSETRGSFPCPWEDGLYRKRSASVIRLVDGQRQGEEILISDLGIHLLRAHHFLQGKGSPFRLEPQALKNLLLGAKGN